MVWTLPDHLYQDKLILASSSDDTIPLNTNR
jgi:hypothetical protein